MKRITNYLAIYFFLLLATVFFSGCALELLTPNDDEEATEVADRILGDWELVELNGQGGPWNITTGDGQELRINQIGLEFEEGAYTQTIEANGERGSAVGTWIWLEEGQSLSLDNTDYTILELNDRVLEMRSESGAVFEYDRD